MNDKEIKEIADNVGELALDNHEYMRIHTDWAEGDSSVENLLRRVSLETIYKVLRVLRTKGVMPNEGGTKAL